jgi:hypothetical protein
MLTKINTLAGLKTIRPKAKANFTLWRKDSRMRGSGRRVFPTARGLKCSETAKNIREDGQAA